MTNTVRIFIGAGCSFEVPRHAYDEPVRMAQLSRRIWYIGLVPRAGYQVGPTRERLIEGGCKIIGMVLPGDRRCSA